MKRILVVLFVLLLLLFVGWCAFVEYTRVHLSSGAYLDKLSGYEIRTETEALIALSNALPIGTPGRDVERYLEAHGVERDQFTGGQFARYQTDNLQVLALLSDPPWSFTLFCTKNTYFVRFILDAQGNLRDIIIDSSGACL